MKKLKTKFSITKEIRQLLLSDSGVTSFVNNRIYPIVAPEDTDGDFICYYRDKYSKEYVNPNIVVTENCMIFIAIISENYDNSLTICELVNEIIEGEHIDKDNYNYTCHLVDSTEDFDNKKYIQILAFDIK